MEGYIICNETISVNALDKEPKTFWYTTDGNFSNCDGIEQFATEEEAQLKVAELAQRTLEEFTVVPAERAPWLW